MATSDFERRLARARGTSRQGSSPFGRAEGDTFAGRALSGLADLPSIFLRGLYGIGKGVVSDVQKVPVELLDQLTPGELPGEYLQELSNREAQTPEMAGEILRSFGDTADLLGDISLVPNLAMGRGMDEARRQAGERVQQFSDNPTMFTVEHLGNLALGGAVAARPAQLGIAARRGAISPRAAVRAAVPSPQGAVRGTRGIARQATREAASEGSLAGRAAMLAEDVIGHPYISGTRAVGRSVPAQLMRNPLSRSEALSRFAAGIRQQGGELNFKADDPRRRWNDLQDQAMSDEGVRLIGEHVPERSGPVSREQQRVRNELQEVELQLRARGIEPPRDAEGNVGKFEPAEADPSDLMAESDFSWDPESREAGMTASGFIEGSLRPVEREIARRGIELKPDTFESVPHATGSGADIVYSGPNGEVIGVFTVDPDMGIFTAVRPDFQGQGIGTRLYQRAIEEGLPVQQAMKNTTLSDQGARLTQRALQDIPEGTFQQNNRGSTSEIDANLDKLDIADEGYRQGLRDTPPSLDDLTPDYPPGREGFPTDEQLMDPNFEPPVSDSGFSQPEVTSPRSPEYSAGQDLLNALDEMLRSEEGSISLFGKRIRTDGEMTIGPIDFAANELGLAGKAMGQSPMFQEVFGPVATGSRRVREWLRRGQEEGTGPIGEAVAGRIGRMTGNQELRRQWDPSRTERLFLRDIGNLAKRGDAQYQGLINDLDIDRMTVRDAPGRVKRVAGGDRAIGQVTTPEALLSNINRVINEAEIRSRGDASQFTAELQKILPGVDPMGLHLMALNAAELAHGLPSNTLLGALGDRLGLDRYADLNRQAQQLIREVDPTGGTPERFRLPDEAIDIDIGNLPEPVQNLFEGAMRQYRHDLGTVREQTLIDEGVISPAGTRAGLAADQPTQFPTNLEDLPLSTETRSQLRSQETRVNRQQRKVEDIEATLAELKSSERPLFTRDPDVPLTYRQGRPTQASMDRAWQTTPTAEAIEAWRTKLGRERETLVQMRSRLHQLEDAARIDPANAPASARNLLTYANEVAPRQAEILREMAAEGQGNPRVLEGLAKELDEIPRTLDELNSAEVYVAYLRDVKDKGNASRYGVNAADSLSTRAPGGARRRDIANSLDVKFERDFRTRAYWQDSEFQNWFMRKEASNALRNQGIVKNGRQILEDTGLTADDIAAMNNSQIQQWLESHAYSAYHPEQLFSTSRKPIPAGNPLDSEWIPLTGRKILEKSLKDPSLFERAFLEGIWDPLQRIWKIFVLPMRPGWQFNNTAGNILMTNTVGKVSPADYPMLMRASQRAVKNWNQGIIGEVEIPLNAAYKAELNAKLGQLDPASNQASMIRGFLDEGRLRISNEVIQDIANKGITRGDFSWLNNSQFMRETSGRRNIFRQLNLDEYASEVRQAVAPDGSFLGERLRRAQNRAQTGREFIDYSYHLNETVDNFHRATVYLDQLAKGIDPELAVAHVNKTMGDYSKLTGFERRFVKRMFPFYPWMRHVANVTAQSLHPSNINRTIIFAHIMDILGDPNEYEEMLPDWASGHIYIGDAEDGTPKFLSTRGLNPWLDIFDPIGQPNLQGLLRPTSPFIQMGYEYVSGNSVLRGEPITSPSAYGTNSGARTPLSEYFFRNVPPAGLARDVYRDLMDQPLTRYGTGEPMFIPGADKHRGGMKPISQFFGVNISTMDVQRMHNQEKVQEFRQEQAERRQELLEETQGGRSAGDLLGGVGNLIPGRR